MSFINQMNENGDITRNKVRLVAQGYSQEEGIDFEETYTLVARLRQLEFYLLLLSHNLLNYFKWMLRSPSSMVTSRKKFM